MLHTIFKIILDNRTHMHAIFLGCARMYACARVYVHAYMVMCLRAGVLCSYTFTWNLPIVYVRCLLEK